MCSHRSEQRQSDQFRPFHHRGFIAAAMELAMMTAAHSGTVNSSLTLRPRARLCANRRWCASDWSPAANQTWLVRDKFTWLRSRSRRGSESGKYALFDGPWTAPHLRSLGTSACGPAECVALSTHLKTSAEWPPKVASLAGKDFLHLLGVELRGQFVLLDQRPVRPQRRLVTRVRPPISATSRSRNPRRGFGSNDFLGCLDWRGATPPFGG